MNGLLKVGEKRGVVRFKAPQDVLERLDQVRELARQKNVLVDLDEALTTALKRLLVKAEKELMPADNTSQEDAGSRAVVPESTVETATQTGHWQTEPGA